MGVIVMNVMDGCGVVRCDGCVFELVGMTDLLCNGVSGL